MGLPGVHSKLWLYQSSSAVSHLPYQLLHFHCTALVWPILQLSIPNNHWSLFCACGGPVHPHIIYSLTYPSSHLSNPHIQLFFHLLTHSSIYLSTHPPILLTIHLLMNSHIKPSLIFIPGQAYTKGWVLKRDQTQPCPEKVQSAMEEDT